MSKITKMTEGKSREKRVNVFLDGRFAFSLLVETALSEGLRMGQDITPEQVETIARTDRYRRCFNAAIHYLGHRPRSEAEIIQRLRQRGFDGDSTERVLARLREQGLADDGAFARFWKENREAFSPRSRQLTRLELQRKGLPGNVIEQAIGDINDGDSAYRAAVSRARRLPLADYEIFRRQLGEYLRRRGFGYDIIKATVDRVWQEHGGSPEPAHPDSNTEI